MNTSLFAMSVAVIASTGVDFTGKEGYLLKNNAGALAVNDSLTVPAVGVVLDGDGATKNSSIGVLGQIPPVRLKAGGAIAKFDQVVQQNDGTVITDPGAGTGRVVVGRALEAAAAGDLFLVQTQAGDTRS